MKTEPLLPVAAWFHRLQGGLLIAALGMFAAACTTVPDAPPRAGKAGEGTSNKRAASANLDRSTATPEALLGYYQALSPMSANELTRERRLLTQLGSAPDTQLRLAMVLSHPRQPNFDLVHANNILEKLQKSNDADVYYLRPIIRLLADSYAERLRQETLLRRQNAQMEKQYQKLLETQRQASETKKQATELQTQLEGLANIERSLPRARVIRPNGKL